MLCDRWVLPPPLARGAPKYDRKKVRKGKREEEGKGEVGCQQGREGIEGKICTPADAACIKGEDGGLAPGPEHVP